MTALSRSTPSERPKGMRGNKPSLTADIVREVRRIVSDIRAAGRVPHWKKIARQLGVRSPSVLRSIDRGDSYRWVT